MGHIHTILNRVTDPLSHPTFLQIVDYARELTDGLIESPENQPCAACRQLPILQEITYREGIMLRNFLTWGLLTCTMQHTRANNLEGTLLLHQALQQAEITMRLTGDNNTTTGATQPVARGGAPSTVHNQLPLPLQQYNDAMVHKWVKEHALPAAMLAAEEHRRLSDYRYGNPPAQSVPDTPPAIAARISQAQQFAAQISSRATSPNLLTRTGDAAGRNRTQRDTWPHSPSRS